MSWSASSDKLEIKQKGKKKAWAKCELNEIVNLHVLMGLSAVMRPSHDAV